MKASSLLFSTMGGIAAMVLSAPMLGQTTPPSTDRPESTAAVDSVIWQLPDQRQSERLFDRLDLNRDGYLSESELTSRQGDWVAVDGDRDGRIGRSEFKALR